MFLKVLRTKIHRATVTQADVDYVGSIAIDRDLIEVSGLVRGECVLVADVENGQRFETYVVEAPAGSGVICVNGAAARLVEVGHEVIIMAFAYTTPDEAQALAPVVVLVDKHNRVLRTL